MRDVVAANRQVYTQELPLQEARSITGLRTVDEVEDSDDDCVSTLGRRHSSTWFCSLRAFFPRALHTNSHIFKFILGSLF